MKINIMKELPYAKQGEMEVPSGVVDEKFAAILVKKGLAELVSGELPEIETKTKETKPKPSKKTNPNPGE